MHTLLSQVVWAQVVGAQVWHAPDAQGQLLSLRDRSNGTDSQPAWIFPNDDWFVEGAGPLTGKPLPLNGDGVSAVDSGYPQRYFYLLSDPTGGAFHLATFNAVEGKTTYTPFADGAFIAGGSFDFAAASSELVSMVGVEGNGTDIQLVAWHSADDSGPAVRFAFPAGFESVFDYGGGFVGAGGKVYYAYLLHAASKEWTLFAIDLASGELVQPAAELRRAAGQCSGEACAQAPVGFAPSVVRPGLAYGLDVDTAGGVAGLQVAELNLSAATVRPIGKIPPGQNLDLAFRFLAAPPFDAGVPPADETYFALLAGKGAAAAPTVLYAVNCTRGGQLVAATPKPWPSGGAPKLARWLPSIP